MITELKADADIKIGNYTRNLYMRASTATEPDLVREMISDAISQGRMQCELFSERVHNGVSYKNAFNKMIILPHAMSIMDRLKDNFPDFKSYWIKNDYSNGRYVELYIYFGGFSRCIIS